MARIGTLAPEHLAAATALLERACAYDRAGVVAAEKLFGVGPGVVPAAGGAGAPRVAPGVPPSPIGAWIDDRLVGVAATAGRYLRVLAVEPDARGRGAGTALLAACEAHARATGEPRLRALDQPGNYLAPGIDERNVDTLAWLDRRGWRRGADVRTNVSIAVRDNPRVSAARVADLAAAAAVRGYEVRRARSDEVALLAAVAHEFGGAWPFELARALTPGAHIDAGAPANSPPDHELGGLGSCVHVALRDGAYCAFAAHDGNNRGLGWFGPTGTWPAYRGQGLGEVLLLACLVDVARAHSRCEVAWIGPRPFYEKVAGIVDERRFVVMTRELA